MESFTNLINFRDLGGIPAADGKTVSPFRLLRSGEVVGLNESEKKALLEEYHLKNIIDLRSVAECKRAPDDAIPGVVYHHVDIMKNRTALNTGIRNLSDIGTVDAVRDYMGRSYAAFVLDAGAREEMREFIDILLSTPDGANLFHCFAGKDRTGGAAAVILTILGANKTDIMADYMRTNAMRAAANEEHYETVRQQGGGADEIEALSMALTVHPEYLERSYDEARKEYGTFENYIREGIGVTDDEIACLREMYLV